MIDSNELKKKLNEEMTNVVSSYNKELLNIRGSRANPGILNKVSVQCYGSKSPLHQVANISIDDSRTLVVSPWDKANIVEIEKAILNADLGLNPVLSGNVIRIPLPPLTEERRKILIKQVKEISEKYKVSIREIRRRNLASIKDEVKNKNVTQDEERMFQELIQDLTDKYIEKIVKATEEKEKELMEF